MSENINMQNVEDFTEQMQGQEVVWDETKQKTKAGNNLPISEKVLLTLEEASKYTGLGKQKLRDISNGENCGFVLWNGAKRMFKHEKLKVFLESLYSV